MGGQVIFSSLVGQKRHARRNNGHFRASPGRWHWSTSSDWQALTLFHALKDPRRANRRHYFDMDLNSVLALGDRWGSFNTPAGLGAPLIQTDHHWASHPFTHHSCQPTKTTKTTSLLIYYLLTIGVYIERSRCGFSSQHLQGRQWCWYFKHFAFMC